MSHYLLSLPRPAGVPEQQPDEILAGEMVRLTCLLMLSELKKRFSLNSLDLVPLRERVMPREPPTAALPVGDLLDLKLWALVTCATLQSAENRAALIPHIRNIAVAAGLAKPEEIILFAKRLVWIAAIQADGEVALERELGQTDR